MPTKKPAPKPAKKAAAKPARAAKVAKVRPPDAPKIGRPATGQTPSKERQSKMLKDLREAGGDKVAAYLQPESIGHMQVIIQAKKFTARKGRTQAIAFALKDTADRLRKP